MDFIPNHDDIIDRIDPSINRELNWKNCEATHSFFSEQLGTLIEILGCLMPNGRMMGQDQQTLLGGKHYTASDKRCVLTAQWVGFFEGDVSLPEVQLPRRESQSVNIEHFFMVKK